MARRIILHIGSPKCGSTYLQRVMLKNAQSLLSKGIYYPHSDDSHPGNAADLAEIDAQGLADLFPKGVHTAVLSHEDLYGLAKRGDPLSELIKGTDITVQLLAFLRPFSEFVFGDYSQFMKQHFHRFLAERNPYDGRDFETFAMRRIQNLRPAKFFMNWGKRFPEHPIVLDHYSKIRPVLENLLGVGVVEDWNIMDHQTNRSLRMEDCDRIAAAMRDPSCSEDTIRAMYHDAYHNTDVNDIGRSPERITWLEDQFKPQIQGLLKNFNYGNRLQHAPTRTQTGS